MPQSTNVVKIGRQVFLFLLMERTKRRQNLDSSQKRQIIGLLDPKVKN